MILRAHKIIRHLGVKRNKNINNIIPRCYSTSSGSGQENTANQTTNKPSKLKIPSVGTNEKKASIKTESKPTLDYEKDKDEDEAKNSDNTKDNKEGSRKLKKKIKKILRDPYTYIIPAILSIGVAAYFYDFDKKPKGQLAKLGTVSTTGVPLIGGSFTLVDTKGRPVTDSEFRGKHLLLYFGFTNCPDICPEELKKMAGVLRSLSPEHKTKIIPLFITLDPYRDSCEAVEEYLQEFHPDFLGLTGTPGQIKETTKKFRVYYYYPEKFDDDDYLVDHSMYIYLMGPMGHLKDYFERSLTTNQVLKRVQACLDE
ncbi:Sco1, mitochondrial [Acrasis kona]|uniref:Sco1, mitochondrial n=1 Tax=Acrasis kona TaxID=1008807 RepID=A0AAW2ZBZ1_9EUKA